MKYIIIRVRQHLKQSWRCHRARKKLFTAHVCMQQLTLTDGYLWSNWDFLLSEAVPTMLPAGRTASEAALRDINASRTSSRGRLHGSIVFSGKYVGTSFIEWTAMSMSPFNSASSISLVNKPFPPMSASGWLSILSPVVLIISIWIAPSSASSVCAAISLALVS